MKLLNKGNTKTQKGEKFGWITFGLHLAPFTLSGMGNVCPCASDGCAKACLNTAGRGVMKTVQKSRIEKTKFFFSDKTNFLSQLKKEIKNAIKYAEKQQMNACFRLNLTSDIDWSRYGIPQEFPEVPFYDYTKVYKRVLTRNYTHSPSNYHFTFSRSEVNDHQVEELILDTPTNIAVVFNDMPKEWKGRKVINGDEHDLRFLDPHGVIVGLKAKGDAKKDRSGFVIK